MYEEPVKHLLSLINLTTKTENAFVTTKTENAFGLFEPMKSLDFGIQIPWAPAPSCLFTHRRSPLLAEKGPKFLSEVSEYRSSYSVIGK